MEQKLANVRRWGTKPAFGKRSEKASDLADRRWHKAKQHREELYGQLIAYEGELAQQGLDSYQIKHKIATRKAEFDEQLDELWHAHYRSKRKPNKEWRKAERYAYKERKLLRQLEDLNAEAKEMYELDDRKDQTAEGYDNVASGAKQSCHVGP